MSTESLDHISNAGLSIKVGDETYTFKTLTFEDRAALIRLSRKEALTVYLEATKDDRLKDKVKRASDINGIVFGTAAEDIDWANPIIQHEAIRLSLRENHPKVKRDEVAGILGTDFDEQTFTSLFAYISHGAPVNDDGEADPTPGQ